MFNFDYSKKIISPDKAVTFVKSGDWVDYTLCVNTPRLLDEFLAKRANELEDINIRGLCVLRDLEIFKANRQLKRNVFTWNSWHMSGIERKAIKDGFSFYSPIKYSELCSYYRNDIDRVDVAMLQASLPDSKGYMSFGVSNSHIYEILKKAKKIIVEINPNMPKIAGLYGDSIHIDDVDAIVENNCELDTLPSIVPTEVDNKIADIIVKEITDGSILQLGIGGLPNAIGHKIALSDLKDLGIHTEMYVDSMMEMAKAGKISGKTKNIQMGKQVFTFAAGSQELYDYLRDNNNILTAPVEYVNNPAIISNFDKFISINNAIEIDLYGQVNAESSGFRHISGAGGQLDFVEGAYKSNGGKSFIALSSTYIGKDGCEKSRIRSFLDKGSIVTDTRSNIHYVVTEYGMVNLKGKSTWQRAEALISIAHPKFRDELISLANKQNIWRNSNKR